MASRLTFALVLSTAFVLPAFAETSAEKQAKVDAAIEACDRGASVPLDPLAKYPVVHWGEFQQAADAEMVSRARELAAACRTALDATPGDRRLALEALRSEALGALIDYAQLRKNARLETGAIAAGLRSFAEKGSAEANFLLYEIYRTSGNVDSPNPPFGVGREEALAALAAAADAGHLDALRSLLAEYRDGGDFRRDPKAAAATAARIMDLRRQGPTPARDYEFQARDSAALNRALILVSNAGFSPDDQKQAFAAVQALFDKRDERALIPYVTALRNGYGTAKDPAAARKVLEEALAAGGEAARGPLAEMMANGEGGAADGKAALALLSAQPNLLPSAHAVLAGLYLDNRFTGRRPRQAIRLLTGFQPDLDSVLKAVPLLVDYSEKVEIGDLLLRQLHRAALAGEPGAAMALARLKLSGNSQFGGDVDGARALLIRLAADGDPEAALLVAETQYANLDGSSFRPLRREGGMSDAEIKDLVDKAVAENRASAYRVRAKLQRVGVIYPQDDRAATESLVKAAELGDVEAMLLAGKAYDDGLGVKENARERLRWWREAAKLGSVAARQDLADAFTFDSFDKLMTLREGVTGQIALYNDAAGDHQSLGGFAGDAMVAGRLSGLFRGSRASEAGVAALAAAVLDAFRVAPAGLDEARLLPLMRELPDEIRIAIETSLKADGFFAGTPDGNFGPDVRAALAAWVDAKGPLPDEPEASASAPAAPAGAEASTTITAEQAKAIRDKAFADVGASKTNEEMSAAIATVNVLARAGDIVSRWALVGAYDDNALIPAVVTPEEMTRYSLDLLVTRPEGAEKVEFEVIFNVTLLFQNGQSDAFGAALVAAVRDDPRLQDPLTLGGVLQQMNFAPGACDGIARAIGAGGGPTVDDGCSEQAQTALIALAKEKGPAGIEPQARAAAMEALKKLAGG